MPATEVDQYFIEAKPLWVGKVGASSVSSPTSHSIPADSVVGLTEGNVYIVTANRTDALGSIKNPSSERETFIGKLSGSDFINCVRQVEGAAQAWGAGVVLEVLMTATHWNKLIEGILIHANLDGSLKFPTNLKSSFEEINEGVEDEKFITPKGLKDSDVAFLEDVPELLDKASSSELIEGLDDTKYATALGLVPFLNNSIFRQALINADCQINQLNTPVNISTTKQFGPVDMFYAKAQGTVGAGTITQYNTDYFALLLSGVTLTGSGKVNAYTFIEASDAIKYKNKIGSFSLKVYHDVGSPINFTVKINKANSENNFSSVTNISNSNVQSIPNTTETLVKFENIDLGDCSNGIEIEVEGDCGAITTKNFRFSNWQFNKGNIVLNFQPKSFSDELRSCMGFVEQYGFGTSGIGFGVGLGVTSQRVDLPIRFIVPKRINPSTSKMSFNGLTFNNATTVYPITSIDSTANNKFQSIIQFGLSGGGITANQAYNGYTNSTTSYIRIDCRPTIS